MSDLHFTLRTGTAPNLRLTGHRIGPQKEFTGKYIAFPSWTFALPDGEDVVEVVTRPVEPVASLGKVLGDRTTLYKYLNPHVQAVITASVAPTASSKSCGIYLVDVVKGTILYHAVLPAAGGACDIKAALAENWLVYMYFDDDTGVDQAKGHRVVSVELYEGSGVDDKTGRYSALAHRGLTIGTDTFDSSSEISSYANATTKVKVYEQSYVFPRGVTALATTSTKFGITSKDLIGATIRLVLFSI